MMLTKRPKRTLRERAEARARRFLRKSGVAVRPEVFERAVDRATAREEQRAEARAEAQRERFDGCDPVSAVAVSLGMKRAHLFEWLEGEGWLVRGSNGKLQPTPSAVSQGFMVARGPVSIRYGQITPSGRVELARRLGENVDGEPIGGCAGGNFSMHTHMRAHARMPRRAR
ncbi:MULTISPECIES: phage antirepressor KilAC domain-containing protein [Burkholderia]|uniref:phage antirepressor KilAC domain-containing protein n=1 Tax=Burkholderia TaxID=32008 RepID=UPI00158BA5F5|nr:MULTISPECIES: phage antirepressor KilAC domain-containing protein [Burkholderia]